jgi:hypothetical protein
MAEFARSRTKALEVNGVADILCLPACYRWVAGVCVAPESTTRGTPGRGPRASAGTFPGAARPNPSPSPRRARFRASLRASPRENPMLYTEEP